MIDTVSIRYVYSVATVWYKMLPEEGVPPGDVNTFLTTPIPYRTKFWPRSSIDLTTGKDRAWQKSRYLTREFFSAPND